MRQDKLVIEVILDPQHPLTDEYGPVEPRQDYMDELAVDVRQVVREDLRRTADTVTVEWVRVNSA